MKEVPLEYYPDDDEEIDYDSDGNPIAPPRSKVMTPQIYQQLEIISINLNGFQLMLRYCGTFSLSITILDVTVERNFSRYNKLVTSFTCINTAYLY